MRKIQYTITNLKPKTKVSTQSVFYDDFIESSNQGPWFDLYRNLFFRVGICSWILKTFGYQQII